MMPILCTAHQDHPRYVHAYMIAISVTMKTAQDSSTHSGSSGDAFKPVKTIQVPHYMWDLITLGAPCSTRPKCKLAYQTKVETSRLNKLNMYAPHNLNL